MYSLTWRQSFLPDPLRHAAPLPLNRQHLGLLPAPRAHLPRQVRLSAVAPSAAAAEATPRVLVSAGQWAPVGALHSCGGTGVRPQTCCPGAPDAAAHSLRPPGCLPHGRTNWFLVAHLQLIRGSPTGKFWIKQCLSMKALEPDGLDRSPSFSSSQLCVFWVR